MSNFRVAVISVVMLFISLPAFSQLTSKEREMMSSQQSGLSGNFGIGSINADATDILNQINPTTASPTVPIEGAIDPDNYIVGPNDMFMLGIYGYVTQQLPLVVNPEGTVLIPTVGEVRVSGETLAKAKNDVVSAVKGRYYSSSVSFTLSTPRTFLIKVSGLTQGTFAVSPVTRVSEILKVLLVDTLNTSKVFYEKTNEREFFNTQISLRNIELFRKDGTVKKVDIYKYFLTNNDEHNPFFLEGDLLKIPYLRLENNFINVGGAVQLGGSYEHVEGDNLETVVGIARGFDVNAEPDSIVLYRSYEASGKFDQINLSFKNDKNYRIQKFDRLFVKYKTNFQKNISVLVLGEVVRPGYYPISFKNTRLKDVVEMAGGFTDKAYLPLCILFRTYDAEYAAKDSAEILINMRASDLIMNSIDMENFETDIRAKRNRVVVDFEKLFRDHDKNENVLLEDKDVVYINDNKNIVYVFGQVNQEGYVPFRKGKDVDYYVDKAGGYGLAAEEGDTRIIKFNSRGWYKPDEAIVETGDFVYVPKQTQRPFEVNVALIAQIAGVILGVLTTYILIKDSGK
ncbi:MAG: SLBB domain-containing protein [Ignavibacteria bacterium]|nr:SLBB domain-containing protein [Ignavibacteria bacterium]